MNQINRSSGGFTEKLKAHIELLDPITWVGVLQGIICGAIASGQMALTTEHLGYLALLALLFGPLGTGFSQSVNDYFDRDLDQINEPSRPIPSGRLTPKEAFWNWCIVAAISVALGIYLSILIGGRRGITLFFIFSLGLLMGFIYSAPPFKLKRNVLTSAPAVGLSYSFITWVSGNLIYTELRTEVLAMALINTFVAIGLIFLNDFKSIEGDKSQGLKSLPIMIGVKNTYLVSFLIIDIPLIWFVTLMHQWGFTFMFWFSLVSFILIFIMQVLLYRDPQNGAQAINAAVHQTGLRNVIGKSDRKEHNTFLRYLVVNNGLYVLNVIGASIFIAQR
ncbi:MAG: (bacterio)chlorophyll synthase [Chloroherpetonaceae bacterium]|nr:(bacterio)chlorophyll synthase [Chloroherpetonaceae bacterium]